MEATNPNFIPTPISIHELSYQLGMFFHTITHTNTIYQTWTLYNGTTLIVKGQEVGRNIERGDS